MPTLLLRLAGPLQSWGSSSKFEIRGTESEPTKSGVIGMLAAALGRRRDEPLDDLSALKFGVRVDRPGVLLRDFHTARAVITEKKTVSYVTYRYYLSDAVFLAAVESDDVEFLKSIENALECPVFPLFLGRRSCPPTLPISLGVKNCTLLEALRNENPLIDTLGKKTDMRIRCDAPAGRARKHDVPVSFNVSHRKYGYRYETEEVVSFGSDEEHDPMVEL